MHTGVYLLRVQMTKNTYMYKIHICKSKYTPGLSRCMLTRGVYLHICKLTFTYMQLRSHVPKYTRVQIIHNYMYNLHTVCKSAHVNGALFV